MYLCYIILLYIYLYSSNFILFFVADFDQVYTTLQYSTLNAGKSFIQVAPLLSINQIPKPTYLWKKNGVQLVEDGRISISRDHALYIADLRPDDAGTYTCDVENPVMKSSGKPNAKQTVEKRLLTVSGLYKFLIKLATP